MHGTDPKAFGPFFPPPLVLAKPSTILAFVSAEQLLLASGPRSADKDGMLQLCQKQNKQNNSECNAGKKKAHI